MAVSLDNLDDVLKTFAKLERAVTTQVIREARKNMRRTVRSYIPIFKKISPKKSGELVKSIRVTSRSRRGQTTTRLMWGVPYAGPVNFRKSDVEGFATDKFRAEKEALEHRAEQDIKDAFKTVLEAEGIKIK